MPIPVFFAPILTDIGIAVIADSIVETAKILSPAFQSVAADIWEYFTTQSRRALYASMPEAGYEALKDSIDGRKDDYPSGALWEGAATLSGAIGDNQSLLLMTDALADFGNYQSRGFPGLDAGGIQDTAAKLRDVFSPQTDSAGRMYFDVSSVEKSMNESGIAMSVRQREEFASLFETGAAEAKSVYRTSREESARSLLDSMKKLDDDLKGYRGLLGDEWISWRQEKAERDATAAVRDYYSNSDFTTEAATLLYDVIQQSIAANDPYTKAVVEPMTEGFVTVTDAVSGLPAAFMTHIAETAGAAFPERAAAWTPAPGTAAGALFGSGLMGAMADITGATACLTGEQEKWRQTLAGFGEFLAGVFAGPALAVRGRFQELGGDLRGELTALASELDLFCAHFTEGISLTKSELASLRGEIAGETGVRFAAAEIRVDMSGMTNRIDSELDVDGVVSRFVDGITEALAATAEGVHA